MSSPSVDTFLASLKRCLATPGFLDAFYDRFMGSSEEVREKFRKTDMKRQTQMLLDSLYVVANAVQSEEQSPARAALPALAARHSHNDLDIRPGLYDLWMDAIVETSRSYDPQFDPQIEAAWREILAFGADYMRKRY